jgi:hypothetical protein
MNQVLRLAGILAVGLMVGCQAPHPLQTWREKVDAVTLQTPDWLQGTWSSRTDNQRTSTSEEFTIGPKWVTSETVTSTSPSAPREPGLPAGMFFSSRGQWSFAEDVVRMEATPQETTSDQMHRIDLVKEGQVLGFVQFEKKGEVLMLTEQHPVRTRTLELRRGKPQDVPVIVAGSPSPAPTPSPTSPAPATTP